LFEGCRPALVSEAHHCGIRQMWLCIIQFNTAKLAVEYVFELAVQVLDCFYESVFDDLKEDVCRPCGEGLLVIVVCAF
jgi:hypothetical protein